MKDFPYYLIIDFEATCDDRTKAGKSLVPKHEMEIIEIGAVLMDASTLEKVDDLGVFVRPVRHPKLTPFCTELTTITQSDVDGAPIFPEAVRQVERLVGNRRVLFCSWGDYDRNQLAQDAAYHGVDVRWARDHQNVKKLFSELLNEPKKFGMDGALQRAGLPLEGTHHRGIDDARNIARLVAWVLRK